MHRKKNATFLPVMYGRPPACAVVDSYGEDTEEQEEAGHAEAHLVDSRVANQSFAVLPCIHLLTQLAIEGDLIDKSTNPKTPLLDHYSVGGKKKKTQPLLMFV